MGKLLRKGTQRLKNFVKIALSSTVFEIQPFLRCAYFKTNSKIQNGRHFLASEIFVETWKG